MNDLTIGQKIEYRRKQLGLTLDDIANEIGVARSTIQRYEKDSIEKVKLPVIEAIARVLMVNPAWLCGKSNDMLFSAREKPTPASGDGLVAPLDRHIMDMLRQLTPENKKKFAEKLEVLIEFQSPAPEARE